MVVKFYKSCSDMPIFNFMMSLHLKDNRFLIKNADDISEEELNSFLSENELNLATTFKEIETEYRSLTFDKTELDKHKEIGKMMYMESKHNAISKVMKLYLETFDPNILNLLTELGIKLKDNEIPESLIKRVKGVLIGLRNKINIKQSNFKIRFKIDEKQSKEEESENSLDIERSLDAQAIALEGALETGYRIDTKKTSVIRWVNLMKSAKEKSEMINKLRK